MRNLIYHIYDTLDHSWNNTMLHFNMRELSKYINRFDRKIIKISTDDPEKSKELVDKFFTGIDADIRIYKNDKHLQETVGFHEAITTVVNEDPLGYTFIAAANGVSREGHELQKNIKAWVTCMNSFLVATEKRIQTCIQKLQEGFACCGTFKKPEPFKDSKWHYSGMFAWINNQYIKSMDDWWVVPKNRHGVETYLGSFVPSYLAYCYFNTTKDLYKEYLTTQDYWPELMRSSSD